MTEMINSNGCVIGSGSGGLSI